MAGCSSVVVNDDWSSIPASSSLRSAFPANSTYRPDLPNLVITGVSVTHSIDRLEGEGEEGRGTPGGRWRLEDQVDQVDQVVPELSVHTTYTQNTMVNIIRLQL